MSEKIIFSMHKVSKVYPPNKQVIRDISLSFYYGAKIGVLGLNGSGKSSLLKIIAGLDTNVNGDVKFLEKVSVGYLPQEPHLDQTKTVKENIQEAMVEINGLLKRFEEIGEAFNNPDLSPEKMEKLLEEQGLLQEKIDLANGWELDRTLEIAMDALRCPAGDSPVTHLSGGEIRRVALCKLLLEKPDILLLDEPTNHLDAEAVGWLEKFLSTYPGTVIAVTHDRYFLDNIAGWILELDRGHGIPWKGNYSSWLGTKTGSFGDRRKTRKQTPKGARSRVGMGSLVLPKRRQAKSKSRLANYEKMYSDNRPERIEEMEIYIPAGPRLGDHGHRR
jgi:sulfate-transporting ATPase